MKKISKLFLAVLMFLVVSAALVACSENSTNYAAVTSISISGSDTAIKDIEQQYNAIITPSNATNKTVTWEISSGTASIDKNGLLLATDTGLVVIKATADGKNATKQITVINPTEPEPPTDPLQATFNGFEPVDATTYKVKVSNATQSLNIGEIATIESSWKLTTDIQATSEIPSKIATPLMVGDNIFYVLVSADNDVRLYTLQIRRRPIYEVAFDTKGGNSIDTQYIEEDSLASAPPALIKNGYSFTSWDANFSMPITANVIFTASWQVTAYDILYILDGGTNGDNPKKYTIETETIVLQDAIKSNYILNGWYLDSTFSQPIESIPQGSYGDFELYASFSPEPKELAMPFIEWNDIKNTITVTNTDANADGVVVTVNDIQRVMKQNENIFTFTLGFGEHEGQQITITAYATSANTVEFTKSPIKSYTSQYINRRFQMIKDPSLKWGASSGIFMFYLYKDLVNYTVSYDGVIIMENNVFVNNGNVGTLSSIAGVVTSPTDFDRYGYTFTPSSPEVGKILTITFTLKNNANPNLSNQYYFASEIVTCAIS